MRITNSVPRFGAVIRVPQETTTEAFWKAFPGSAVYADPQGQRLGFTGAHRDLVTALHIAMINTAHEIVDKLSLVKTKTLGHALQKLLTDKTEYEQLVPKGFAADISDSFPQTLETSFLDALEAIPSVEGQTLPNADKAKIASAILTDPDSYYVKGLRTFNLNNEISRRFNQ